MNTYKRANLALWNEWTALHARSEFYNLQAFKAGRTSLDAFEMEELGDVAGKTLLHLQCHFGMDTLSWSRLGAKTTGVDFSDQAIHLAQQLNLELGLDSEFICADIYELPDVLDRQYDIVYTSKGVLAWLPDLKRWAEVIAQFVKPGGYFYIAEFHPFVYVFDDGRDVKDLQVRYSYFHSDEPLEVKNEGSYASPEVVEAELSYQWQHSLGDILNALTNVGLRIQFLHEFPFTVFSMFPPLMEKDAAGLWRLKEKDGLLPLMFSLKAVR